MITFIRSIQYRKSMMLWTQLSAIRFRELFLNVNLKWNKVTRYWIQTLAGWHHETIASSALGNGLLMLHCTRWCLQHIKRPLNPVTTDPTSSCIEKIIWLLGSFTTTFNEEMKSIKKIYITKKRYKKSPIKISEFFFYLSLTKAGRSCTRIVFKQQDFSFFLSLSFPTVCCQLERNSDRIELYSRC